MSRETDETADEAAADQPGQLRVLHVDSPDWLSRVREHTEQHHDEIAVADASTGRDALEILESESIDCVVTTVALPDFDVVDFLDALASTAPDVPVILYTDESPESAPDEAVERASTFIQRAADEKGLAFLVQKIKTAVEYAGSDDASARLDGALGLVALDADGDLVWSNEEFELLFSNATDDGSGRSDVGDAIAARLEDPGAFTDRRTEAIRDGSTVEQLDLTTAVPAEEDDRVIEYRSYPVSGTASVERIELYRDVTREREYRAGQEKLETLETLVETARDGLYITDENGYFTYLNESLADMLGYERDELVGRHGSVPQKEGELRDGQKAIQNLIQSDERESEVYDMVLETKDGEELIGEINFALLPTENDAEYGGLVGVIRDVTERREQEERVRRQRAQLEKFASVVAHDLRNPLTLLQASLEGMSDVGDRKLLEDARRSADRMDRMIDDLLELAGAGEVVGDPEPVDLEAVCEECWRRSPAEEATLRLEDDLGTVEADRGRLAELLENLFRNAVEHGSTSSRPQADDAVEHGSTSPRSQTREDSVERRSTSSQDGNRPDDAVEHGSTSPRSRAHEDAVEHGSADVTVTVGPLEDRDGFAVADDGPGIPDEQKSAVFDHGFTSSPDGTGFGLSIAAEIVEAHGWSIEIRDAENGGARFEIETGEES